MERVSEAKAKTGCLERLTHCADQRAHCQAVAEQEGQEDRDDD